MCVPKRERESSISNILAKIEDQFPKKASAARRAWERYFAIENLPDTVTDWSLELLAAKGQYKTGFLGVPLSACWEDLSSWHFYRRGIAPEIEYWVKSCLWKPTKEV